ncbi:MAG: starch-binding protein [Ruminococcus sp.]|nr:starch-binding protein [Ruminococcus sp.]
MSFKKIAALILTLVICISAGALSVQAATAGENTAAEESSSIIVHFKSTDAEPYVYYWNSLPKNIETKYPGVKMTKDPNEGEDWYTYKFDNVTKINMLFTDKNGNQLSKELTRNSGEWWYKNKIWSKTNREKGDNAEDIDFREESIYFVITTRFYNGDKSNDVHCWDDGVANNPDSDPAWRGDFKGLAQKLDYIKALGFSAIWITPVVENASGYDYHGYHAMDFSKVDSRYESSDFTYEDLIEAAHSKDMKIVQDVVWNHTGNFGEGTLCKLFERDYNADLSNLQESMIPTKTLLDAAGVKTAAEYWALQPGKQYDARLNLMKNVTYAGSNGNGTKGYPEEKDYSINKLSDSDKYNANNYWHTGYFQNPNYDDWTTKFSQIAGDCVDLNTENPAVAEYTTEAYAQYINMGVDGFRVDTVRHIPRLTLNMMYNPQILSAAQDAGKNGFYMFGEICTRYTQVWYRGHAEESAPYYTWKESNDKWEKAWKWDTSRESINSNMNLTFDHYIQEDDPNKQPSSDNAFLNGITYHNPDDSKASGMNAIDFTMHRMFGNAGSAFGVAKSSDKYYNDATYNVMYVDSHDYAPENPDEFTRFSGGTQAWAENMDLMFTFRGIPCLYYGSEVEFKKGELIDKGTLISLENSGRAYFGDYLEGTVTAKDFGQFNASGKVKETLDSTLSKQLSKLNMIRRAIPALQKGQYTTSSSYVSGDMAFIRRYTNASEGVDSLACVAISGSATFKNVPNGKYIDAVTGDVQNVTNGTLTVGSIGKANMRVYVCCASGFTPINGKIGGDTTYLK